MLTGGSVIITSAGTGTGGGGGGGGTADSVQAVSSTTSVGFAGTLNTLILATAGSGGITLTLPTAIGVSGQKMTFIQIDTGAGGVTIAGSGSQKINGTLSSYELANQWQAVTLQSNNVGWVEVGGIN